MPIYDYVCSNCRHRIEVIHGIHDDGPRFCPSCGAEATMRKAPSSPAVHFKGSGWAKKDRSSTSGTRTKAAASSPGSSSDGGTPSGSSPADAGSATGTPSSTGDASTPKED